MVTSFAARTCITCGKPLSGRLDKKFCDDQCRATFNNKNRTSSERLIMDINRNIRRNRSILKKLCPLGKATVRRTVLEDLGFDFNAFSSIFPSDSKVYYFSYEYGFTPIIQYSHNDQVNVEKVVIIQEQDYMKRPFDPWSQPLVIRSHKG